MERPWGPRRWRYSESLTERPRGTPDAREGEHAEPNNQHSESEVGQPHPGPMIAGHHLMWWGGVATGHCLHVVWGHESPPPEEESDHDQENPSNGDRNPGAVLAAVRQRPGPTMSPIRRAHRTAQG